MLTISRSLLLAASLLAAVVSCTGDTFTSEQECVESNCAGVSGGGANAGPAGGASSGGLTGGTNLGGVSTAGAPPRAGASGAGGGGASQGGGANVGGGAADAGAAGDGCAAPGGFPNTCVLDDFDRSEPTLGSGWMGATENYSLTAGELWCEVCNSAALWSEPFGANQEVFATFSAFDPGAPEMNLVLRAQESASCELIEVLYSPASLDVRVAYCVEGAWTDLDALELLLKPGQQLGARARADGTLDVFVDGDVIGTFDISGFPGTVGRIGVDGISAELGLFWDDFGGGEWQ